MKLDIQDMKKEMKDLNDKVQASGRDVIEKENKLMHLRKTRENLTDSVRMLRDCDVCYVLCLCEFVCV